MGERVKRTRAFRVLLIVGLLLILAIPALPVHATTLDQPDNFASGDPAPLSNVYVNRNVISPGDMVIYFSDYIEYETTTTSTSSSTTGGSTANVTNNITEYSGSTTNTTTSAYDTEGLPLVAADQTYVFRFYNTDNSSELGYNYIYPYHQGGYNMGMGIIYFAPAVAPTWGEAYVLAVQGLPDYFTVIPDYRVTLDADNYSTKTSQTDNKVEFRRNILTILHTLELEWGVQLTTQSGQTTILTSAGASYLQGVMPGIQYVLEDLFEAYLSSPDYATAHNWGTNMAQNYTERYGAYSWVGNFTGGVGSLLGGSSNLGSGMIVAGLAIFCVIWASMKYQSPLSGMMGSLLVLMCGYLVGWLDVVYFGLCAFVCILYTSTILFLNRS